MFNKQELIDYCNNARENFLSHISIDCVVFGFHEGQLKVLVLKMKNECSWYLPGGFVLKNEPIDEAANRILKDRTGLDEIFLQQFQTLQNAATASTQSWIMVPFLQAIFECDIQ